ncbi:MAG TPA: sigma 54-interacting transcriptional regulator [Blastocatellia bacterium]|nr:sigma 54-interacting transcriptional regulator [Blastocatellia bacterium]
MIKAWHHFLCGGEALPRKEVIESLLCAGLDTTPLDLDAPASRGVLFFDKITSRTCDLLREVSRNGLERVLAIAASRSALAGCNAWQLLGAGASDVFAWDHSADPAAEVAARFERWDKVDQLVRSPAVQKSLVGQSRDWVVKLRQIVEVANFTNASVLLLGESGTGKEMVARLIHSLDSRPKKRDLVVLDCATISPELSGSEFFGHERGAFTGAIATRDGAFSLADGGTLFLDEVGELPLALQAELLRVVQEHTYKPLGSNLWRRTDFRLVCATNRDLLNEVEQGRFRRDLYSRIASWTCRLPPLRERLEDILPLARHFIDELRDGEPVGIDDPVVEHLLKREYPANVRDLKQLVTRMVYRHVGPGPITVGDIPEEDRPSIEGALENWCDTSFERAIRRALVQGLGLKEIGRTAEDTAERLALDEESGSLQRAARRLGVTDRALQIRRASRKKTMDSEQVGLDE